MDDAVSGFYRFDKSFHAEQSASIGQASLDFSSTGQNMAHRLTGQLMPPVSSQQALPVLDRLGQSLGTLALADGFLLRAGKSGFIAGAVGRHEFDKQRGKTHFNIRLVLCCHFDVNEIIWCHRFGWVGGAAPWHIPVPKQAGIVP